jgi:peptidoglycan-associated lipoprotein
MLAVAAAAVVPDGLGGVGRRSTVRVQKRRTTSVTTHRRRVALLGAAALSLLPLATPAWGASSCGSRPGLGLAQLPGGRPLADPIPHIPINGTAGFVVPGANSLAGGNFSVGLGYLGQEAVCQQESGIFDQNTLFLALGYGITERIQISFQVPYTWYEADKANFNGDGFDDLSLGLGYRFLDEAGWVPALSVIGYGVAPTAERSEGLGTNEWSLGAALAASKTLVGPLSAFATAGYQYNGRGGAQVDDQFISGLGLAYAITPNISVLAEGTANTNWRQDGDRHSDWIAGVNAGVRMRFGGFLISVAGRKGITSDAPDWGVFALVTYEHHVGTPFAAKAAAGPGAGGPGAGAGAPGAGAGAPGAGAGAPGAGAGAPGAGAGGPGAGAGAPGTGAGAPGAGAGAPGAGAGAPGAGAGAPGAGAGAPGAGAGAPGAGAGAPGAGAGAPGAGAGAPGTGVPGAVTGLPPAALPPALRSAVRDVNFEFDQYNLTDETKVTLDELGQALKANPEFLVTIEGHADERGTVEYNVALGEQRAQAVRAYLVALGVDGSRIDTISYGEQRPVDAGKDELAYAINRRAHFLVRRR